jgi:hypothetical protein
MQAARAANIELRVEGNDLVLEASAPPATELLDLLSRHKPGIVALLQPAPDSWSPEDWQAYFDERAGIAQFDGRLPRPEAEVRAFACCVAEWLNRTPVKSPPGRCLCCGGGDRRDNPLLPFGTETTGHVWLHSRCWPAWQATQEAGAVAGIEAMGIKKTAETGRSAPGPRIAHPSR